MKKEMHKNLVINMYVPTKEIESNIVRIDSEARQKIAEIQRNYGVSARRFVSALIMHYADDVEFVVYGDMKGESE